MPTYALTVLSLLCALLTACAPAATDVPPTRAPAPTAAGIPTRAPAPTATTPPAPSRNAPPAESSPAPGISLEAQAQIPPIPPPALNAEWRDEVLRLSWSGTGDDTLKMFTLYRRYDAGAWQPLAVVPFTPDSQTFHYDDRAVTRGASYEYAVSATNQFGVESVLSSTVVATIP